VFLSELAADLEGTPRPIAAGFDIGAFEGVNVILGDGFELGSTDRWALTVP
jgi:hypothetical protein